MDVLIHILAITDEQRGWVALAIALACIGFLLFRSRFRKRDPLEKPAFGSLAQQRSVERQMQNLLVEFSEMARQMSAQLDTRAARLEELIRQADEKIALLDRSHGGGNGAPPIEPSPSAPEAPQRLAPQIDPRHAEIYALADEGKSAREIAAQINQPTGEIELILALRQRA